MKNMINTIGKIIHTLVKENTPRHHKFKIRRECGFSQKFTCTFFYRSLCFLPYCCANIGREVRLMLPNTYQEIFDTHICLNSSKICPNVFVLDILKSWWILITLWGIRAPKKIGWEVIFSELGLAGSGACKPQREFEGSALEPFFHVFLRLSRALIV